MINTALLEATMCAVRDFPELHDQSWFFTSTDCGTAMCFGARACSLAGLEQVMPGTFSTMVGSLREQQTCRAAARDVLGLDERQANILFHPGNTSVMLEWMVKDLCNGGDVREWDYYRDLTA